MHESNVTGIAEPEGLLLVMSEGPVSLEERRRKELAEALARKCPKLQRCKSEGAISVLALETNDWTTFHYFLASELWSALAARQDAPDEVFLVDTTADAVWAVVPLKRGARILSGRAPTEVLPDSLMDITANPSG